MRTKLTYLSLVVAALVGCRPAAEEAASVAGANSGSGSDAPIIMDEMPPMIDDGHPEHGPHEGDLVELGKEAFHAELVHGDGGISIYVLDGSATQPVAIASEKLVVSLKRFRRIESFDLAANPETNDPAGQTTRFTSTDRKLAAWLDSGAEGVVVIQIEGKSYTGKIDHANDHQGHN